MKTRVLYFLLLLIHSNLHAQNPSIAKDLPTGQQNREQFIKDSTAIMQVRLVRPQFKLDNRVTWYEGQSLGLTGFDVGVLLKEKLRLTLGYYQLNENLNAFKRTIDSNDLGSLVNINYGALNTEFIYKNTRFISLGMPLEFGFGQNELRYKNFTTDEVYKTQRGFLAMAHFGMSGTFKPIRWIGLKGIIGYRKSIYNQVKDFNFDGIFFSLGLNLDVREIIKDIQMYNLKKRYKRGNNLGNAVDLITD
jgi:hypothetical protein